jgi:hypothetical protein
MVDRNLTVDCSNIHKCRHLCQLLFDKHGIYNCQLAAAADVNEEAMSVWRRGSDGRADFVGPKMLHALVKIIKKLIIELDVEDGYIKQN